MTTHTIHVDVVSTQELIYSGEAEFVVLPVRRGSSASIRAIPADHPYQTGEVRIKPADGGPEEFIFVAGGVLEVQPKASPYWLTPQSAAPTSTRPGRPKP